MINPQLAPSIVGMEQVSIYVSEQIRLAVLGGVLVAYHAKLAQPIVIDAKQLERWLLRQLREQIA